MLNSVSCPAVGGCTAVGSCLGGHGQRLTLAETFIDGAWAVLATPSPGATISQRSGVWCSAAANCTAVGTANTSLTSPLHPLAERWNGSTWEVQANPGRVLAARLDRAPAPAPRPPPLRARPRSALAAASALCSARPEHPAPIIVGTSLSPGQQQGAHVAQGPGQ